MGKKKLERYREIKTLDYYYNELTAPNGNWDRFVFHNKQPIVLELGCGYGDYTIALSRSYSKRNFVGVDLKSPRMYVGVRQLNHDPVPNAAFLRCHVEFIDRFFSKDEVDEIWITFPDPFLKNGSENRRLTSAHFLDKYRQILKDGHIVNLKTDNQVLYDFTLEVLEAEGDAVEIIHNYDDIYALDERPETWDIKTNYEKRYIERGITIKLISFKLFHKT